MRSLLASLLIALLTSGCTVGPDYKRPTPPYPRSSRRFGRSIQSCSCFAWRSKVWDVFRDEQLQSLVRTRDSQNYDVRISATRVLQAQAQLGITVKYFQSAAAQIFPRNVVRKSMSFPNSSNPRTVESLRRLAT